MSEGLEPKGLAALPAGSSLERVGQVLLDAWEVGGHRWTDKTDRSGLIQEEPGNLAVPAPSEVIEFFRLLRDRQVTYLVVGGIALLTHVPGRNTKDLDLLMSAADLGRLPELKVEDQNEWFARGRFRSLQVDVLLTANAFFELVAQRFICRHRFDEFEVPVATADGLILLKLYALPSLYRQGDFSRVNLYESDVASLVEACAPALAPLLAILRDHVPDSQFRELRGIVDEIEERVRRFRARRRE